MKKFLMPMLLMVFVLIAGPARADMTYAPFLFDGRNEFGDLILDGTYAMVLDLDGDGWNGNSYLSQASTGDNFSSWLWDSQDLLMDLGQILNGEATPFKKILSSAIPSGYTANSDHFYLLWFNKPFIAGAAGPGGNIAYGSEDLGTVGTDPGDYGPFAVGGSALLRTVNAVPEPVSSVLALLGGGAMAFRRKFMRKNA